MDPQQQKKPPTSVASSGGCTLGEEYRDGKGCCLSNPMRRGGQMVVLFLLLGVMVSSLVAHQEDESVGDQIENAFVTIGSPHNKVDPLTGYGSVPYAFSMGKYEITAQEYCAFLNAVARKSDPYFLYQEGMSLDSDVASLERHGNEGDYYYIFKSGRGEVPIVYVNLYSAARFCNWLHNGQPEGSENGETTERGAYTLDGAMEGPLVRDEDARYFIPNENEWYKAAYYDPTTGDYYDFPNRSNWAPHFTHDLVNENHNEANYDNFMTRKGFIV